MQNIPFIKMHGNGNDFVVIDTREIPFVPTDYNLALIADRRFGIGCDQLILIEPSEQADIFMRIFNADGSEAEACGNATRCIAWLVMEESGEDIIGIDTQAGVLQCTKDYEGIVTVRLNPPALRWMDIPLLEERDTLHLEISEGGLSDPVGVNMGNPHAVFFVQDISAVPLAELGPKFEHHSLFPERANISVVQVLDKATLSLMVWERGSGLTQACGSAACASVVAAVRRGLIQRKAEVVMPGGSLHIEWEGDGEDGAVIMSGSAEVAFTGHFVAESYKL